jgi:hypothetical protein
LLLSKLHVAELTLSEQCNLTCFAFVGQR